MTFLETRGMLAKLLATENLIIEHDSTADTASFNTATRTLRLPVLRTKNEHVYNLFVAHEVGHALETPVDWKDQVPEGVPFDFVNVIEDVRIERFIQNKFPGLKRDFSNGYTYLAEQDFFALEDRNIFELNLIDRINLHFKLGSRALMPFNEEEMVYVKAVEDADTFQKVCLVSKLISDYMDAHDTGEQTEFEIGEQEGQGGDRKSSQSGEDDTDADPQDGEDSDESQAGDDGDKKSKTQKAFDDKMQKLQDGRKENDIVYLTNPAVDFNYIISVDELREDFAENAKVHNFNSTHINESFAEFVRSIKRDVTFMAQQFEMRKSADLYRRSRIARTGVLDTNKLHNYKLTDDLFLRHDISPEGKNHGMVMLLDWSGSMDHICVSTVKQIIVLAMFCRKVSIPFIVYTFTNGNSYQPLTGGCVSHRGVKIVNVLDSRVKRADLEQDMKNLFSQAWAITYRHSYVPFSNLLMMSGTPLMNALFMMPDIIKKFQRETNTQKMSFVCITDGDSHPLTYGTDQSRGCHQTSSYFQRVIIRKGSQAFSIDKYHQLADVVRWLRRECPDVSLSHIFLGGHTACSSYVRQYGVQIEQTAAEFGKNNGCVLQSDAWPVIACLSPKAFGDAQEDIVVDAGAKKADIRKALNKYLKSHNSSRVILGGLVESMA